MNLGKSELMVLCSPIAAHCLKEIPGGCMCCVNGLPMQVGLNTLLRQGKPDRLLIEPTGLGHPKQIQIS